MGGARASHRARRRLRRRPLSAAALAVALAGCGGGSARIDHPPRAPAAGVRLTSPAFAPGATVPRRFTCDGAGTSPPLRWSRAPAGTEGWALLVTDPDAPGGTFVHWTVWNLAGTVRGLAAGALPAGARQGTNSADKEGWTPPCPPSGTHRYVFDVYALRRPLSLASGASGDDVRAAIARAAIARGELVARYGR